MTAVLDTGFAPPLTDSERVSGFDAGGFALSMPRRPTVEVVTRRDSPWVGPVLARANELARLAPGWDGLDAPTPTFESIVELMRILANTLPAQAAIPHLVPTVDGGVQAEWHRRGFDLEIEVDAGGDAHVWWQRRGSDELHEGDPRLLVDDVRGVIAELS